MADGFERRTGEPYHNLRAALFPRAVRELGALVDALGGRRPTVDGLADCGDLQVTIASGRNRLLGERIGRGEPPQDALAALPVSETSAQGYLAAGYRYRPARTLVTSGHSGRPTDGALPNAPSRIWDEGAPPLATPRAVVPDDPFRERRSGPHDADGFGCVGWHS